MTSESMDAVAHARRLNEERMRAWRAGQALLEHARSQRRDLLASEQREFDRITAEIDRLDRERDVYLQADIRQREAEAIREADYRRSGEAGVRESERAERELLLRFLDVEQPAIRLRVPVECAAEEKRLIREGVPAHEARALAWDTGSVASAVPTTTARSLYSYLEASVALLRAPTTKVVTASGEAMLFPKFTAHPIGTQVAGQGTTLAGTDPVFGRMQLDSFKYGELVVVSSEVLQDTVVDIGQVLGREIGMALGRVIDVDFVTGSGSGKPQGIMTSSATGVSGTVATGGTLLTPSYENLVDLKYSVNDAYRNMGNAGWLMRDQTAGILTKLRDGAGGTTGRPIWEPSLTAGMANGEPDRLLGFPVFTDPSVASCASNARVMCFGDFSAFYIRTVGPVMLERDDSRWFDTDQVGFRGKWRVDSDLLDAASLNILRQSVS